MSHPFGAVTLWAAFAVTATFAACGSSTAATQSTGTTPAEQGASSAGASSAGTSGTPESSGAPATEPSASATDASAPAPEANPPALVVGGDRDAHGCIGSAGYSWCARENQCARPWELARTRGFAFDGGTEQNRQSYERYCSGP